MKKPKFDLASHVARRSALPPVGYKGVMPEGYEMPVPACATAQPGKGICNSQGGFVPHDSGESRPFNNMGLNSKLQNHSGRGLSIDDRLPYRPCTSGDLDYVTLVLDDSGESKIVPVRKSSVAGGAVIDWVNFTVSETTFHNLSGETLLTDELIVACASRYLHKIFGFGITSQRDVGMNFYTQSYVLGDGFGFVCFGGNRATLLVTLNGLGCLNSLPGWETRLHDFLNSAIGASLSRVDIAVDDFNSERFSVDSFSQFYDDGGFSFKKGGRPVDIQTVGNWRRPNGRGRTLYIGARASSKFLRVYEKGMHLGDSTSRWVRAELELKKGTHLLPFDVLLSPEKYFSGAYPCLDGIIVAVAPTRLEVRERTAQITIDRAIEVTYHQFGRYLRAFREIFGDFDALEKVCSRLDDFMPKRLLAITASIDTCGKFLHDDDDFSSPRHFSML